MTLVELVAELCERYKLTHEQGVILGGDLRAAGVHDGPALYDAHRAWRGAWKSPRCPTAGQFAEHYRDVPSVHAPHASGMTNRERMMRDMELSNRPDSYRNTRRVGR